MGEQVFCQYCYLPMDDCECPKFNEDEDIDYGESELDINPDFGDQ